MLRPHPALKPPPVDQAASLEQQLNESAWCQAYVERVVSLILPPEDLANPCLSVMVEEVASELIMHNAICGKACESWLLWEGVTKLINTLRPKPQDSTSVSSPPTKRLEQYGLLSSDVGGQDPPPRNYERRPVDAIAQLFWSTLQYIVMAYMLLRAFVMALMHEASGSTRSNRRSMSRTVDQYQEVDDCLDHPPKAIVEMRAWSCLGRLMSLQDRMPWLSGSISLVQWLSLHGPGQVCRTNSTLDR